MRQFKFTKRQKLYACAMVFFMNILIGSATTEFPKRYSVTEDYVSIISYGANGTDHEADSKAFQAAINDAGKRTVYVPSGTYILDKTVELKNGTKIVMHKNAVIKSEINTKISVMFVNFPLNTSEAVGASDISIKGGTIDMNGVLGENGKAQYLHNAISSNAIAFGYAKNITIEGVVFKNNFNAHSIQLADITNAVIKDSRFTGYYADSRRADKIKEAIQIEPGVKDGFPYVKAETRKGSKNIIVENCLFDTNIQVGVGTHYQIEESKVKDIIIRNNKFVNMKIAAIRFPGWENVEIEGNKIWINERSNYNGIRYGIQLYGSSEILDKVSRNKVASATLSENISIKNNEILSTDSNVIGTGVYSNSIYNNMHRNIDIYNNEINYKKGVVREHIYLRKVDGVSVRENILMGNSSFPR